MPLISDREIGARLGITFTDSTTPPADVVRDIIDEATEEAMDYITYWHVDERIDNYVPPVVKSPGNLGYNDGINKIFYLKNPPVADYDADGQIMDDISITVYDVDSNSYQYNVSISSVDALSGRIELTTAPPKNAHVYATYHSYITPYIPPKRLLAELTFVIAAEKIWRNAKFDLLDELIESYSVSGVSINKPKSSIIKEAVKDYKQERERLLRLLLHGGGIYYG